jgi:UDP-N-acetylmuramate--alanine ligase
MFTNKKKVHLIGIGGIGMSGIARLLVAEGCKLSGSDLKASRLTDKLKGLGAEIFIGHSSLNVQEADSVIYSSAIKQDNPELMAARSAGIRLLSRAQALAELANQKKAIAVTGAHGKTTTSSLISHMLITCGLKPTVCVGGELISLNSNAFCGEGRYFVLEADESDGSFLNLNPVYSIVTNIDQEHLDYYRDLTHISQTFLEFMRNTKREGCVFFCRDDPRLLELTHCLDRRCFSFGLLPQAEAFAQDIKMQDGLSRFKCIYKGEALGEITLHIAGRHNICNGLAAISLGLEIGLDFKSIQGALASYKGVRRRLELKSQEKDIRIFEDYAHHPTEIRATLEALKGFRHKRLLAVFQPHRYTRTQSLIEDFGRCFQAADHLIVTDIYSASEAPIKGVSAENICQKAREAGINDTHFLPRKDILPHLLKELQRGDLVAVMGAGDIGSFADVLAERIKSSDTL